MSIDQFIQILPRLLSILSFQTQINVPQLSLCIFLTLHAAIHYIHYIHEHLFYIINAVYIYDTGHRESNFGH